MQHEDCRIVTVLAADRDPLLDAADQDVPALINSIGVADCHGMGDFVLARGTPDEPSNPEGRKDSQDEEYAADNDLLPHDSNTRILGKSSEGGSA
jgi:hypothetical protein